MNIEQILQTLPHRYPFVMVDRVLEITPGGRIVALKNVTINEPYFVGHFPRLPVMPGVLIIEALAQAAAILTYQTLNLQQGDGTLFYFAGIDGARFKRPVIPGDQLRLEAELIRVMRGIGKFKTRALVDGALVAEAELMCAYRNENDKRGGESREVR
jgi:3-hydroxyacyl-[acyl-carrier-protein] dehydratase